MPEAIIDIRCWYCESIFIYRKKMRGEFKDGRYLCPKCIKALKPLGRNA